jgi:hypothetical protein
MNDSLDIPIETMIEPVTRAEFLLELSKVDWFYMMSDDNAVYHKGRKHKTKVMNMAKGNAEFDAMYKKIAAQMNGRLG